MDQNYIVLNDGNKIPQLGFGTYMIFGNGATKRACLHAFESGYRHIDTAHVYRNERGVGAAVEASGLKREQVWITSKLWINEYGKGKTAKAIDKALKRLKLDYIDLLLLHRQGGDYEGAWSDLERAKESGKVKSIGLSNFEDSKLEGFLESMRIKPSVLQVECHPYMQQKRLLKRIEPYGIKLESWYPLGHGDKKLLSEKIFLDCAAAHGKTPAQIILRWHIQSGHIVFPKSTDPSHIEENMRIFDFELSESEMEAIAALERNGRYFKKGAPED